MHIIDSINYSNLVFRRKLSNLYIRVSLGNPKSQTFRNSADETFFYFLRRNSYYNVMKFEAIVIIYYMYIYIVGYFILNTIDFSLNCWTTNICFFETPFLLYCIIYITTQYTSPHMLQISCIHRLSKQKSPPNEVTHNLRVLFIPHTRKVRQTTVDGALLLLLATTPNTCRTKSATRTKRRYGINNTQTQWALSLYSETTRTNWNKSFCTASVTNWRHYLFVRRTHHRRAFAPKRTTHDKCPHWNIYIFWVRFAFIFVKYVSGRSAGI